MRNISEVDVRMLAFVTNLLIMSDISTILPR